MNDEMRALLKTVANQSYKIDKLSARVRELEVRSAKIERVEEKLDVILRAKYPPDSIFSTINDDFR